MNTLEINIRFASFMGNEWNELNLDCQKNIV
jgi:hypothetical protein